MAAGFWSRLYGLDSAFCDCQPAASLTRMVARKKAVTPGFFLQQALYHRLQIHKGLLYRGLPSP
jgi:hypothetical protein